METLAGKAAALWHLHRFDETLVTYALMKRLDPENAAIEHGLGHLLLLLGNFEEGWTAYEARLRIPGSKTYPEFPRPMWLGETDIAGKTILICADEGIGDQIQFVRFVPMVAALGARIIIVDKPPLSELLS